MGVQIVYSCESSPSCGSFSGAFLGAVLYLVFLYLVFLIGHFFAGDPGKFFIGPCRYMGKVGSPFFFGFPVKDIQDAAEFPAVCF